MTTNSGDDPTPPGMAEIDPPWEMRSAVIDVSELERSTEFYRSVMDLHEELRADRIAILTERRSGSPTLLLRQAYRHPVHAGEQALGLRALVFDVGPLRALDGVEQRLRHLGAFQRRGTIEAEDRSQYVLGHDPDRLPLVFLSIDGRPGPSHYRASLGLVYGVDV